MSVEDRDISRGRKFDTVYARLVDQSGALITSGNPLPMSGAITTTGNVDVNIATQSIGLSLGTADVQIGAVELKDATTTNRAIIDSSGNLQVKTLTPGSMGDGSKAVTNAGAAEAIAGSTTCTSINVQAKTGNTGAVYIGGNTIATGRGIKLQPGDSVPIDVDNLADVYVDVDTSGEGITFTYTV